MANFGAFRFNVLCPWGKSLAGLHWFNSHTHKGSSFWHQFDTRFCYLAKPFRPQLFEDPNSKKTTLMTDLMASVKIFFFFHGTETFGTLGSLAELFKKEKIPNPANQEIGLARFVHFQKRTKMEKKKIHILTCFCAVSPHQKISHPGASHTDASECCCRHSCLFPCLAHSRPDTLEPFVN